MINFLLIDFRKTPGDASRQSQLTNEYTKQRNAFQSRKVYRAFCNRLIISSFSITFTSLSGWCMWQIIYAISWKCNHTISTVSRIQKFPVKEALAKWSHFSNTHEKNYLISEGKLNKLECFLFNSIQPLWIIQRNIIIWDLIVM